MPKVNIVTTDGRVVAVDESNATELDRAPVSSIVEQTNARINEQASAGVIETGKAAAEGALDAATFGGYGLLRQEISDQTDTSGARDMAIRAQAHPYARVAGEAAAILAPTGLLGGSAALAGRATAIGLAGAAGRTAARVGGKYAGLAVEGALIGAGAHVASTNVTGDPLTIEGVVSGAGVGALLGVGTGAVIGLVSKAGKKAGEVISKIEDRAVTNSRLVTALEEESIPAYRELRAAHEASEVAARAAQKQAKVYEEFASGAGLKGAIKETTAVLDKARNAASAELSAIKLANKASQSLDELEKMRLTVEASGGEARKLYESARKAALKDLAHFGPGPIPSLEAAQAKLTELGAVEKRIGEIRGSIANNPKGVLEDLRVLRANLSPDLPPLPAMPAAATATGIKLPETVAEFARMGPETTAALANSLSPDAAAAVGKLADHLGLAKAATPAETLSAIRSSVKKALSKSDAGDSNLAGILKKGVGGAVGGMFGGPVGTIAGVAAGSAAGGRLSASLEKLFVRSKAGTSGRIGEIVKQTADKSLKLNKQAPVTAVLGESFPHLHPDVEPNISKRALNRINEIRAASVGVEDSAYMAVQPLLGHPGDIATKVANQITASVRHLEANLPAPSATNTRMGTSDWSPQYHETLLLAYRLEAVQYPEQAIKRALSGDGHPVAIDTLWTVYPAMMSELAGQIVMSPIMQTATYQEASVYSQVFRRPMSGLQTPEVITAIQSKYLPPLPPQPGAPAAKPAQVTGRPSAVQSPVAGSSVSGLTSQV